VFSRRGKKVVFSVCARVAISNLQVKVSVMKAYEQRLKSADVGFATAATQAERYSAARISGCEALDHSAGVSESGARNALMVNRYCEG
jgi:hypothetical protein